MMVWLPSAQHELIPCAPASRFVSLGAEGDVGQREIIHARQHILDVLRAAAHKQGMHEHLM